MASNFRERVQTSAHTRTFRHERYRVARDTTRSFPANVHPLPMTVHEYKARRETVDVSDDGIFRAKQPRQPRHLQVEASAYEQKSDSR